MRSVVAIASLACLACASTKQPHILLIVADDLGWNDVPWTNPEVVAPNLQALRQDGITLGDYHLYKVCSPTRASLMTGRYPNRAGLHDFLGHNAPEAVSANYTFISESMKEAGYATHMVGKWHLGYWDWQYIPTGRGFESFFGYMGGAEDYFNHTHTGCDAQPSGPGYASLDLARTWPNKTIKSQPQYKDIYSNEVFLPHVQQIIDDHPPSQPLFLFFPVQHVHEPLQVPERYTKPYEHLKGTLPEDRITLLGMVGAMDEIIGDVVKYMQKKGLWDNTIMIFSTDNGGNVQMAGNNYPLRGGKFTFWEGGNRGAAFIYSASESLIPKALRNKTYDGLFHVADWYATIAEVGGASLPASAIDSVSQWSALCAQGKDGYPRSEIIHETNTDATGAITLGKIRSGKWNLYIGTPFKSRQKMLNGWIRPDGSRVAGNDTCATSPCLFDMETDVTEHYNVASEHPEIVKELLAKLTAAAVCPDSWCELDHYTGPNDCCEAFDVYGAYGPWAKIDRSGIALV